MRLTLTEQKVGNSFADALLRGPSLLGFQANFASNVQHEVQCLMDMLASPDLNGGRILFVSATQGKARSIEKALEALTGSVPERSIIIDLVSFRKANLKELLS